MTSSIFLINKVPKLIEPVEVNLTVELKKNDKKCKEYKKNGKKCLWVEEVIN